MNSEDHKEHHHNLEPHQPQEERMPVWVWVVVLVLVVVGVGIAIWSSLPETPKEDAIVAIVGSERIRQSYLDRKYNELGPSLQKVVSYEQALDQVIEQRLLVQEAKKRGITIESKEIMDRYEQLLNQTDLSRREFTSELVGRNLTEDDSLSAIHNTLLVEKLLGAVIKINITDGKLRELYELNKNTFLIKDAVRISHILVIGVEDILAVQKMISNGSDFSKLAAQWSIDEQSKAKKGDLGFRALDSLPEEWKVVVNSLKVGEVSNPVKSSFGWHILKLTEKKDQVLLSFEEVRMDLEKRLNEQTRKKAKSQFIEALIQKTKIEKMLNSTGLQR